MVVRAEELPALSKVATSASDVHSRFTHTRITIR